MNAPHSLTHLASANCPDAPTLPGPERATGRQAPSSQLNVESLGGDWGLQTQAGKLPWVWSQHGGRSGLILCPSVDYAVQISRIPGQRQLNDNNRSGNQPPPDSRPAGVYFHDQYLPRHRTEENVKQARKHENMEISHVLSGHPCSNPPLEQALELKVLSHLVPGLPETAASYAKILGRMSRIAQAQLAVQPSPSPCCTNGKDSLPACVHLAEKLAQSFPKSLSLGDAVSLERSLRTSKVRHADAVLGPKSPWDEECDQVVKSLLDWYGFDVVLEDIDNLELWFAHFTQRRNYKSTKRARYLTHRFFRAMEAAGHIPWNPCICLKLPPKPANSSGRRRGHEVTILTPSEIRRLLWVAMCERPDIIPLLVLLIFAGLQPKKEAFAAEHGTGPHHVHLKAGDVKTRQSRDVFLNEVIQAWWDLFPRAGKIAGSMKYPNFRRILRRLMKKAGVRLSSNVLRHTFCSVTLALKGNAVEMKQAGHGLIAQRRYRRRLPATTGAAYLNILPPAGWIPESPFNARRAAGRRFPWDEAMRHPLSAEAIQNFLYPSFNVARSHEK